MHSSEIVSQFSTIDAILRGIYDGPATFGEVRRYGDFGIGTLNHLDGEMLALDGIFYQITGDGLVHVIPDKEKTSFATVAFFNPTHHAAVNNLTTLRTMQGWLERHLGSKNFFWSIRIDGIFSSMRVRSISRQHPPYRPLVEVVRSEAVFKFRNIPGTLLGFRSPPYIKGINVPGYHFHFISDDRTKGGHVLGCSLQRGKALWSCHRTFQMKLPDDPAFRQADFSEHDAEALKRAEQ